MFIGNISKSSSWPNKLHQVIRHQQRSQKHTSRMRLHNLSRLETETYTKRPKSNLLLFTTELLSLPQGIDESCQKFFSIDKTSFIACCHPCNHFPLANCTLYLEHQPKPCPNVNLQKSRLPYHDRRGGLTGCLSHSARLHTLCSALRLLWLLGAGAVHQSRGGMQ